VERLLLRVKEEDWVRRFSTGIDGITPRLGGMAPGTGFALGAGYKRSDLFDGRMTFATGASTSMQGDRKFDLELSAPKLANGKLFTTLYGVRHEYGRLNYYGPGANSEKTGRTDYRLEDTAIDGTIGARPVKHLTVGASAGYLSTTSGQDGIRGSRPRIRRIRLSRRRESTCSRTSSERGHSRNTTGGTIPTGRGAAETTSHSSTTIATVRSARAISGGWI